MAQRIPAAANDFLAPNYRGHRSPVKTPFTRGQQKEFLIGFRAAFFGVTIELEEIIAEGDRIVYRSTMCGTHQGQFLDVAPIGRKVTFSLLDMIRVADGRFVERWSGPDIYGLLPKLGED